MARRLILSAACVVCLGAGPALACSDVASVMAHFEKVKDAYLVKAPTLQPDQFPVWTDHLERFGDAMGAQDFVGACQALDEAASALGFEVAAAPTSVAPTNAGGATANGGAGVSVGSDVVVGSGVTIGSGGTPAAPVRTRARPTRIRIR